MATTATKATVKPAQRKPQLLDLDAIAEDAGDAPEILPRMRFTEGKVIVRKEAIVVFQEDAPRIIEWTNPEGEEANFPVIEVVDEADGTHQTLACSAGSIQKGLARIKQVAGTLKGQRARVSVEAYKHKKWGNTIGYRVVHLNDAK